MSDDVAPATASPALDVRDASTFLSRGRSERALDAVTFFLADVADGLGPFLVIDLTTRRGWTSSQAGLAMASLLVGTVAAQTLTGAWIDSTVHKRQAIVAAATSVAIASVALFFVNAPVLVCLLQGMTGVAVTIFPPAIAAVSLGLVGRARLPSRAGRNEACFHAGNVVSSFLAIMLHRIFGPIGIFLGVAAMALASASSALFLRESDIDHALARGADRDSGDCGLRQPAIAPLKALLRDRRILSFATAVVLFHFANAAMLPLVGQKLAHRSPANAPALMAVCIIVAQIAMIPVALLASRAAAFRRRPIFLVGFAVLPIRGILSTWSDSPQGLVANQVLDGVGAGIFGVMSLLVMADLTRGTGRFNFAQGLVATAIGLGAAASNFVTGVIVDRSGYDAGFHFLTGIAVIAAAVFVATVPETAWTSSCTTQPPEIRWQGDRPRPVTDAGERFASDEHFLSPRSRIETD